MDRKLAAAMARVNGVAHIQDLLGSGFTRYQVAALHRSGQLLRPRVGWYVTPTHDSAVIRAVRAGGVLDCVSAAASYGLPVPRDHRVHVGLAPNAARLRATDDGYRRVAAGDDNGIVRHWGAPQPRGQFRVGLLDALSTALGCVDRDWAVGMVDAALYGVDATGLRPISGTEFARLSAAVSPDKRRILERCSDKAESVLESVLRVRLEDAGLNPAEQVVVGRSRVDFMIDGWLVIECDGRLHAESERFASDRARDAQLAQRNLRVLRFTYAQIVDDWPGTLRTILAVLGEGRPALR
ncbi:endonuclease domain-containing protein [Naasia lichenicola]|nr:DUF559 domain-containing protein [Naasia lichenicola]